MATEWEIQKRSKSCHTCEREFAEGNLYHCMLRFDGTAPVRRDICEFCWDEKMQEESEKEGFISHWKSRVKPILIQKKEDPIHRSVAENLLRKYIHSSEGAHKNLCFVLALMLERKKILVQRERTTETQSGKKLIVYEHGKSGDSFIVEDPQLNLSEISEMQKQVDGVLKMEQVAITQEEE
jgi:hypothetical protein